MGFSVDGYPFVGPVPAGKHEEEGGTEGLYLDVSFQGHGMVLCFLCAKAVCELVLGRDGKELDSWFPKCYRVSEERLRKRFKGRPGMSGAPEPDVLQKGVDGEGVENGHA